MFHEVALLQLRHTELYDGMRRNNRVWCCVEMTARQIPTG
ncbi:hypothetical protein FHX35_002162 [Auritidibacter ignavus]|nr:hypothetical protein [Auritidibacter ignavus]